MFPYDNNYCSFKNMGDEKSIFTTSDDQVTTTTPSDNSTSSDSGGSSIGQGSGFSPLAPPFQSRINMDLLSMMTPQEPQVGDTAPSNLGLDFMNLRIGDSDSLYDDRAEQQNDQNYFMGSRTESVASPAPASGNMWTDTNHYNINSNDNKNDTIDFFLKTFAVANTYASMLTREQTSVLKDLRPGLIYEFLHDIIRIRSEKRMQRALPNHATPTIQQFAQAQHHTTQILKITLNECAFCKNNGENEEKYASHALKDWKGRVQCPVLRAFRCPRCGATGDRAHTIKYCPANDHGMDRQGSFQRRRNSFLFGESSRANYGAATPSFSAQSNPTQFNAAQSNPTQFNAAQSNPMQSNPAQSPDSTFSYASFWSNLGNSN